MSTGSKIEWTEATWSPTTGCDRISPGCDNWLAWPADLRVREFPAVAETAVA